MRKMHLITFFYIRYFFNYLLEAFAGSTKVRRGCCVLTPGLTDCENALLRWTIEYFHQKIFILQLLILAMNLSTLHLIRIAVLKLLASLTMSQDIEHVIAMRDFELILPVD